MGARLGRAGTLLGVAAIAAVTVAGCGSSSSSTGTNTGPGGTQTTSTGFQKIAKKDTGTPQKGGILNVLGTGDVDFLDPNITYYTVGYMVAREYSRQLYTYPSTGNVTNVVPDLATGMPKVSSDGKTYTVTIKKGVMWDTSPARQITGADEVRGLETTCNPSQPFGGMPDFESLIAGMTQFCTGMSKVKPNPAAIQAYMNSHSISGVTVSKSDPETVSFKLTQPATYFTDILAIPATSPRPQEMMKYLPASAQEAQNEVSDGPYRITSYNPAHSIDLVRNPSWSAGTDTVRHAYVDEIKINETGQQDSNQQQLQTGTPSADMTFDVGPNPIVANQLITKNDPNLNVQSSISTNPYIIYNTQSPNNNKALDNVQVRQALSYAINRNDLIQDAGGPKLSPPLTHILPAQIDGSPPSKDWYPYNPSKAKSLLQQAGASNLKLTFLYRPASDTSKKMFETVQNDLSKVGVTVKGLGVPDADFYVKYLEVPSTARNGTWDLSLSSWGPDWYGNAAKSFFSPLFDGRVLPPSSSNFGLFNDPAVNKLIDQASTAKTLADSNRLWAAADNKVMADAAIFPITNPNAAFYTATQVHNAVYMPSMNGIDMTNVWLDPSKNGD